MKAKKRFYLLVLTCCAFLFLVHFGGHRLKSLLFESRMSTSELAASSMKSPSSVASFHKRSKWSALIRKTNTTQYQELLDNRYAHSYIHIRMCSTLNAHFYELFFTNVFHENKG